jgi:hypothetical protein
MITNQEHLNNLIVAAFHREMEFYQYQMNINNYTMMLSTLPQDDWPETLQEYKTVSIDTLPETLSDEMVNTISDYQYRDRIRGLLRTEKVEQGKSGKIRDVIKIQIGPDYDSLVAAYKNSQTAS